MRVKFAYAVPAPAAVEMLTACSKKSDGEAGTDEKNVVAGHAAPFMGKIAYPGKHNENGAQLAVEQITTERRASRGQRNEASDTRAILTTINRVQPDVSKSGGMDTTNGPRAKQAATFGIRAKILGGDGVCTDKVGELAGSAMRNPVCSKAEVALSTMTPGVDFEQQGEDRSHTPVQIDAPFTYEALCVIVDAMKRANSFDAPKVLAAMPSTGYGVTGHIAFDHKGDLKEGAITLYDFRDSERAVLDAVEM
jgi:branched-chain amino acid transport system substrate-binding protein